MHSSATNKLTYAYNVRSWLTGISGNKFTQNLYYNTGNGVDKYNGNISSMTWKAGTESTVRGYKFTYDGLDRMLNATYGETAAINTNANRFSENVTGYDKNGNIKSLQRYGQTAASSYGLIDNLTFTLNGNQLTRVDDAVTASAYNSGFEFKDAVKQANEYAYDANGNLTKDLNKNITDIQYNFLNLPSKVTFSDESTIAYTYATDGTKLRTVHKIGSTTTTTDYCGDVIYENGVQKLLLTEEGYVTLNDSKYHYYLQDHQGNNRVVINQSGAVEETNHYYPFGGVFASNSSVQPYKYNGKEYDNKKGLNWYDYGARHYDAALGIFTTVDPSAEKYHEWGSYNYCFDNPIKHIDPDGSQPRPARPVRRGYRNGGRPNPYAFYPGGFKPQSYRQTTNFIYRGTGLRQQIPLEEQCYLQLATTPEGNKVQVSSGNNRNWEFISGMYELVNKYIDFENSLLSISSTVKYAVDGTIQKSFDMVLNNSELALRQLDYEAKFRMIDENMGKLNFEGKSLQEIIEISGERKRVIQNQIGLSPKEILWNEFLTNPEAFQVTGTDRYILPEIRARE